MRVIPRICQEFSPVNSPYGVRLISLIMNNALIARIKSRLKALGKSARQASLEAGGSEELIRTIFRGKSYWPRSDHLRGLAAALETTEDWLISGEESGDLPAPNARPAETPAPRIDSTRSIPVYGTAAGSLASNGAFQMTTDPVDWVRRPPGLANVRDAYAVYIEGESMSPKFEPGDLVLVHPGRPARIGDAVVIQVKDAEHAEIRTYIKFLGRRTEAHVICRQINPDAEIKFARGTVIAVHRVLTTADMLGV